MKFTIYHCSWPLSNEAARVNAYCVDGPVTSSDHATTSRWQQESMEEKQESAEKTEKASLQFRHECWRCSTENSSRNVKWRIAHCSHSRLPLQKKRVRLSKKEIPEEFPVGLARKRRVAASLSPTSSGSLMNVVCLYEELTSPSFVTDEV